jgi:hypothetical protein
MDKNKFKRDEDITGLDETKNDDSANSSPVKKIKILDAASSMI